MADSGEFRKEPQGSMNCRGVLTSQRLFICNVLMPLDSAFPAVIVNLLLDVQNPFLYKDANHGADEAVTVRVNHYWNRGTEEF